MRTFVAGLVLALIYGAAVRVFILLRARRESSQWHWSAVGASSLLGGIGLYAAQQIRMPHPPAWRDLPAFAILCLAASSIPLLLELGVVVPARLARKASIGVPAPPGPPAPPPSTTADTPPNS